MKRIVIILAGLAAFMAALTGVAGAQPTVEQKEWACPGPFTTQVTGRPDSGVGGGTWAHDTFTRTTTITCNLENTYTVTLTDSGHFKTVAGVSPQLGVPLSGGVVGTFKGGATMTVTSAEKPHAPPTANAGDVSSSQWPSLLFGEYASVMGKWGWTYNRGCEQWVNASTGNEGDITGKSCVKPTLPTTSTTLPTSTTTTQTTTTTTTAPVTTTTTPAPGGATTTTTQAVAAGNFSKKSGDLAYTGTNGTWVYLVIGAGLLIGGMVAVLLVRRRKPAGPTVGDFVTEHEKE